MGATVSSMATKALNKWVYESVKHITANKLLKQSEKAAGAVNGNNFNTVVTTVCQRNGVPAPAANVITDYRTAVGDLATCIGAFSKMERDQLKTVLGRLAAGRAITAAEKDACALPIGRARGWGTNRTTIRTNFNNIILTPMITFIQALGLSGSLGQTNALRLRYPALVYPMSTATWIDMILT